MDILQPSTSNFYKLKLPELPADLKLKDEDSTINKRLTLECRTGAAVQICRSSIFAHGGMVIPLNLSHTSISQIQSELILYFAKEKHSSASFKNLQDWISLETFCLDLVSRIWRRVPTTNLHENEKIKERLLHSMCYLNKSLYIFGGLIVSPQNGYELIATNELWRLNLLTKQWELISSDPQVTRRFNHTMLVQNSNDDNKDTKLIIVGGLNNMDQSLNYVDVFNVNKNQWESVRSSNRIITNLEGKMVCLTDNVNCPILLEGNEGEVPTLAFYVSSARQQHIFNKGFTSNNSSDSESLGRNDQYDLRSSISSVSLRSSSNNSSVSDSPIINPIRKFPPNKSVKFTSAIAALPLHFRAQGVTMISNQYNALEAVQNNLIFTSSEYFNSNIVVTGITSNKPNSKRHCFLYNLRSAKWTVVNIECPDIDVSKHRFWKLCIWKSHHQALLLGTLKDEMSTCSVQKFDCLLSFGLPMTNVLNKSSVHSNHKISNPGSGSLSPTSPTNIDSNGLPRQQSFTSNSTSQFENYIKYITTPLEIESTSSVFPPYAMVLGKDGFDIFGESMADFEFITSEGESLGVPTYLLRKRWGRYFDLLLSSGYSKALEVYDKTGVQSALVSQIPEGSEQPEVSKPISENKMSNYSLDTDFDEKNGSIDPKAKISSNNDKSDCDIPENSNNENFPTANVPNQFKLSPSNSLYNVSEDPDPMAVGNGFPNNVNLYENFKNSNNLGTSTTSSSTGMVFRVPFQERNTKERNVSNIPNSNEILNENRRRSSLTIAPVTDNVSDISLFQNQRRASHPTQWPPRSNEYNNPTKPSTLNVSFNIHRRASSRFMSSAHNSRNPSVTSQNSSISFFSSNSQRRGNSIIPRASASNSSSARSSRSSSPVPGLINISLPPQSAVPQDPIPTVPSSPTPIPIATNNSRKYPTTSNNSFAELYNSNRSSPFSSRRPSKVNRGSSFAESVGSLHSPRSSGSEGRFFLSPSRQRRQSSYTSNQDSLDSLGVTNGNLKLEPLLTPRSLYMPWPTASVRAFTEFFYTGQINKKWLLAPVVTDLFIMAKLYEIPLLYEMISEVLYSIIGKKEEYLHVTCDSLEHGLNKMVYKMFNGDSDKIKEYLDENETYKELVNLKESIDDIDSGFNIFNLLKSCTRNLSTSTAEDSDCSDAILSNDDSFSTYRGSLNASISRNAPISISGCSGPRFSNNSIGPALSSSSGTVFQNDANVQKKTSVPNGNAKSRSIKSSLSKELNLNEQNFLDKREYDDDLEQRNLQGLLDSELCFTREKPRNIISLTDDKLKLKNRAVYDSNSSQSDSDEFTSQLDGLSRTKMAKTVREEAALDEFLDPLYRFSKIDGATQYKDAFSSFSNSYRNSKFSGSNRSTIVGSLSNKIPLFEKSLVTGPQSCGSKGNSDGDIPLSLNEPTLENIISPDAPPPVDYILKSIHRATVLTNDSRIMIRCKECIELSKILKNVKKKLGHEVQYIEDKLKRSEKSTSISSNSSQFANGQRGQHKCSTGSSNHRADGGVVSQALPRTRTKGSAPNFKLKQTATAASTSLDPSRRKLSKLQSISPKSSFSIPTNTNPSSSTNFLTTNTPSGSSTKLSMYPPFISTANTNGTPPKSKKELHATHIGIHSSSSTFSFFSKKNKPK